MRILKLLTVVTIGLIILGHLSSATLAKAQSMTGMHLPGSTQAIPADHAVYANVCTLTDSYLHLTGQAQDMQRTMVVALAQRAADASSDPTQKAFLGTVPAALSAVRTAQTAAAQEFVRRECAAHDAPLAGH